MRSRADVIRDSYAAALAEARGAAPEVDPALLTWMEKTYPPRCYYPERESLESHMSYAGIVAFIETLRNYQDQRMEERLQNVVDLNMTRQMEE